MAGGFGHVVQKDGNLASWQRVTESLDTPTEVFDTVREMYGMIWFLAGNNPSWIGREKQIIENARNQYKEGLKIAKEVNG